MVLRLILVCVWVLAAGRAAAEEPPPPSASSGQALSLASLDPALLIPAPPAPGSLAALADLETVLQVQALRTPSQEAWARRIDQWSLWDFSDVLGPWFQPANLPTLQLLVTRVEEEVRPLSRRAKELHPRLRPPSADPRVKPCLKVGRDKSYPSGHALALHIHGAILGDLFPEQRVELAAWTERAVWSRVIGGAHFPSDIVAGRLLCQAVMGDLRRNPAYQDLLERCRAEVAALRMKRAG